MIAERIVVILPILFLQFSSIQAVNDPICDAVEIAEKQIYDLREAMTANISKSQNISEIKKLTADQVRAQLRTFGQPFAEYARQASSTNGGTTRSTSTAKCFEDFYRAITASWHYMRQPHKYRWYTPYDYNSTNTIYFNVTSRLDQLEAIRNDFLFKEENGVPLTLTVLREKCEKFDPDGIQAFVFSQSKSITNELIDSNSKERKSVYETAERFQAWAWTILRDFHRSASLGQMCLAVRADKKGGVMSNMELENAADTRMDRMNSIFDRLNETETKLKSGASGLKGFGMVGLLISVVMCFYANY